MKYEKPELEWIIFDNTISTIMVSGGEDEDPEGDIEF
jgi:hypothetical protein